MDEQLPAVEQVATAQKAKKDFTTEELREYNRQKKQRQRDRDKAAADKESWSPLSTQIPSKTEALEILEERIKNEHVRETSYTWGLVAADQLGIPANRFFWRYGLQETLRVIPLVKEHEALANQSSDNAARRRAEIVAEVNVGRAEQLYRLRKENEEWNSMSPEERMTRFIPQSTEPQQAQGES